MGFSVKEIDVRRFYDSIVSFDEDEDARDFYYEVMDTPTGAKDKVGDCDPLHMTAAQRKAQNLRSVSLPKGDDLK